ncbi:hypothetical protein I3843_10G145200 [Carya illinoinensis]|uniref:UspA domain-containing protein n=1 Tax=Carya illinoinensis TaxID=32201 RepID=A0A922DZ38_CARIL|nr:hypothetical protein I3760_10G152200 [Carya illinoinensis]KAG6693132.1 hypothetical protein I3842_10G151200 [Carya illinoinensis]KAG7960809.1 hypothetical protein I3843_10G145200 [Carya illinoinensis]
MVFPPICYNSKSFSLSSVRYSHCKHLCEHVLRISVVAIDLSDEFVYAVCWAVHHYIRPGDAVVVLHVSSTSILFSVDWGSIDLSILVYFTTKINSFTTHNHG